MTLRLQNQNTLEENDEMKLIYKAVIAALSVILYSNASFAVTEEDIASNKRCIKLIEASTVLSQINDYVGLANISNKRISTSCVLETAYSNLLEAQVELKQYTAAEKTYETCISLAYTEPTCHAIGAKLSLITGNGLEAKRRAKVAHSLISVSMKSTSDELQGLKYVNDSDEYQVARKHLLESQIRFLDRLDNYLVRDGL